MNPLQPLAKLRAAGMVPHDEMVWLGIGFLPDKRNALQIDPDRLPTDDECKAVAGLDVLMSFCGHLTSYSTLRTLCGRLYQARPRRLQVHDRDYRRVAYLKLGGTQ